MKSHRFWESGICLWFQWLCSSCSKSWWISFTAVPGYGSESVPWWLVARVFFFFGKIGGSCLNIRQQTKWLGLGVRVPVGIRVGFFGFSDFELHSLIKVLLRGLSSLAVRLLEDERLSSSVSLVAGVKIFVNDVSNVLVYKYNPVEKKTITTVLFQH